MQVETRYLGKWYVKLSKKLPDPQVLYIDWKNLEFDSSGIIPRLPSPILTKDPSAPIQIRKKSLPDIFRHSAGAKDVFYSVSLQETLEEE